MKAVIRGLIYYMFLISQDFKDNPIILAKREIISNKQKLKPNTLKQIRSKMREVIIRRNEKQTQPQELKTNLKK